VNRSEKDAHSVSVSGIIIHRPIQRTFRATTKQAVVAYFPVDRGARSEGGTAALGATGWLLLLCVVVVGTIIVMQGRTAFDISPVDQGSALLVKNTDPFGWGKENLL
jgi:hypothetical protein